jgi:hypothetical protein
MEIIAAIFCIAFGSAIILGVGYFCFWLRFHGIEDE